MAKPFRGFFLRLASVPRVVQLQALKVIVIHAAIMSDAVRKLLISQRAEARDVFAVCVENIVFFALASARCFECIAVNDFFKCHTPSRKINE